MASIHILSESLVRKIAAGEVIERPASVVKELVENAIDAGATKVQVQARAGGRQMLAVADDGQGMTQEDLLLCVERHATSKMDSPSDLFAIETMGFRGEALSSIGAVSMLQIDTRREDQPEGWSLVVEGGVQKPVVPRARAVGTTVEVRQLFFNTPARRKFLKPDVTEVRHIVQTVSSLAAAWPQVGFEVMHQDRPILALKGGTPRQRAGDLLKVNADDLHQLNYAHGGVEIGGFIAPPEQTQRSKSRQYLLVRRRPVYARRLIEALYQGYGGLLGEGNHPLFLLQLHVDPRQVDVNVHPAKREVRLADEKLICDAIEDAVRRALELPETRGFVYEPQAEALKPLVLHQEGSALVPDSGGTRESHTDYHSPARQMDIGLAPQQSTPARGERANEPVGTQLPVLGEQIIQWQDQYLLATVGPSLWLVDQHLAHQRVLYEQAMRRADQEEAASQPLLIPLTLNLDAVQCQLAQEAEAFLQQLGFSLRPMSQQTLLVDAIPAGLDHWDEGALLQEILEEVATNRRGASLSEVLAKSYAAKAALPAGKQLALAERRHLMQDLLSCHEPLVGPSGKPVVKKITPAELDAWFARY